MKRKINLETFPSDQIIKMICDEYGIHSNEFNSEFKYGDLPEARQLYCVALSRYGVRNVDIARLTGYAPGRVNYTIQAGEKVIKEKPYFLTLITQLIKYMKSHNC